MNAVTSLAANAWTPHATAVLERAIAYFGGLETWRSIRTIRLVPKRLSGLVPRMKGVGRTFPVPTLFEIEPHERVARFVGYPDLEHVGVFQNGSVRLERHDGSVVTESPAHRDTFSGPGKARRWGHLDALYFFGYALTHYHSLPFSLLDARLVGTSTAHTRDGVLDVLDVELPADLPTHGRRQQFYFDSHGRLTRHDYHAEIIGFWARGAHFWNSQVKVEGFPIALDRYVVARLGRLRTPLVALHATFHRAEILTR